MCDEPNRNPLPESHQPGSAAHAIVASRSPAGLRKLTVCSGEHVRHVRVNSGVPSISPPGTHGLIADCIIPHHEVVYGRRESASLNDRSFLVANKVSAHHCTRCVCDRLILGTGGAETGSPDDCFLRSVSLWDKDQLAFLKSPHKTLHRAADARSASQVAARLLGQIQYFGGQAIVLDENALCDSSTFMRSSKSSTLLKRAVTSKEPDKSEAR